MKETFETVVSTMEEFMGSPVLAAVSTGAPIVTPNTPLEELEAKTIVDNIWDKYSHDDDEEEDPNIEVEVVYKERTVDDPTYDS